MQEKISTLVGIIIILVAVALLFGGVFAYQHFATKLLQNSNFFASRQKTTQTQNQTVGWKTYTNKFYGIEVKHPDNWSAEDDKCACLNDANDVHSDNPVECICPGINAYILPSNSYHDSDEISIFYGKDMSVGGAGAHKIGNIKIGSKEFSKVAFGEWGDIIPYINKTKNKEADLLSGKYCCLGPYFADAFYVEYIETSPENTVLNDESGYEEVGSGNKIKAIMFNYDLGSDIFNNLKEYYAKTGSFPPDISAITPHIWLYNTIMKDKSIIDDEENLLRQMVQTLKVNKN